MSAFWRKRWYERFCGANAGMNAFWRKRWYERRLENKPPREDF
jgi:hypothetical protein